MGLTKNNYMNRGMQTQGQESDEFSYPCANAPKGCKNLIRFTPEDEERFRKMDFVNKDTGEVTKPRYCRNCKAKRQMQQQRGR